jgi:Zn-dependent peptidase ImmA (M78 family)
MYFTQNTYEECSGTSTIACYDRRTNNIWFDVDIDPMKFQFVFLHEYGHYLTLELPPEQLIPMFGSTNTYEKAANDFYIFVAMPAFRTDERIGFWLPLLNKKI